MHVSVKDFEFPLISRLSTTSYSSKFASLLQLYRFSSVASSSLLNETAINCYKKSLKKYQIDFNFKKGMES